MTGKFSLLIIIALATGVFLGSKDYWLRPTSESVPATGTADPKLENTGIRTGTNNPQVAEPTNEINLVLMAEGMAFAPEFEGMRFVGYRVVESSGDPRFSVGDTITALDNAPVEGTAAGSELLIIAITNPETPIQVEKSGPSSVH